MVDEDESVVRHRRRRKGRCHLPAFFDFVHGRGNDNESSHCLMPQTHRWSSREPTNRLPCPEKLHPDGPYRALSISCLHVHCSVNAIMMRRPESHAAVEARQVEQ